MKKKKDQSLIKCASLNESDSYDDFEGEFLEKSDTKQSSAQQKIVRDEYKPLFFKKIVMLEMFVFKMQQICLELKR